MLRMRAVIALWAALAVAAPMALGDDPFYAGKRLTILINFAAGGPTDIEGHCRSQVPGRGGAARWHHGRLLHRHRLHVRARSGALSRRLQDLPVRRDPT